MRTVAVLLLLWLASPARAADISAHTNMWGVTLIDIDGFIQPGDEQKFAKLNYPSAIVRLSGPGGFMGAALDFAERIWKRGYTTLVWRGSGPCGSACAIIWLHGRKSAVQRNSYLCFHQAYDKDTGKPDPEFDQYLMDRMKAVGLTNRQAWALAHAASPNECRPATEAWARELGFQYQVYPSFLGTQSCSARWCVGAP